MAIFFADAPAYVESGEVVGGERAHGHAEIVERLVDRFDAGSFLHQKDRLADVGMEHAIAHEAAAVADQHADLPQFFRQLHAGGDHFLAAGFAAHDFEQTHDVGRTEEVGADDRRRPRGGGRDLVDVQSRSVAGQDCARLAHPIEFTENFLLQRHAFEDCLDHHVRLAEVVVTQRGLDQLQSLVNGLLGEASALHRSGIVLANVGEPAVEGGLVGFLEQHRNAGVGEYHGDAAAHGSGARPPQRN